VRKIAATALIALYAGCLVPASAAPQMPPADLPEAFAAMPAVRAVTLSANGRVLAWIQSNGSQRDAVVYNYAAHRVQRVFHIDPRMKPWALCWDGSDMLLLTVTMPVHLQAPGVNIRYLIERILALDVKTGQTRALLMSGNYMQYVTAARLLLADPHRQHGVIMFTYEWSANAYRPSTGTLIHSSRADSGWQGNLFAVDPRSGDYRVIGHGNAFTIGWVVSRNGRPLARTQYHPRQRRFLLEARRASHWQTVYQRTAGVQPDLQPVAQAEKTVLAIVPDAAGNQRLLAIPLAGGAPKNLLPDTRRSVSSLDLSDSGRPLGVSLEGGRNRYRWLDPAAQVRYASVAHAFPGIPLRVYDASRNGSEVLAEVRSPVIAPIYYLTDFAAHRAMVVGQSYPQLAHMSLGTSRNLTYRTDDGESVHATLLLPRATVDRNLPLVLLPPGGPQRGSSAHFDWLAGFLVANGYAVLRPQLTSIGVNGPGTAAGTLGQWDGVSQNYALAGVRTLIKQGVVDAHRVCIVGVSYGGYAALAGAAFSPRTYACAVSINGISDLPAFVRYEITAAGTISTGTAAAAYWRAQLGSPSDPKLLAESPLQAASAVRVPVLLMHCTRGAGVLFSQSQEMADALTRLGKSVTLIRLPGMDLCMDHTSTRSALLHAIGPFLRKVLH
jgi:dipeptidyl aminopeptidase/acylaminoacyl peptidase